MLFVIQECLMSHKTYNFISTNEVIMKCIFTFSFRSSFSLGSGSHIVYLCSLLMLHTICNAVLAIEVRRNSFGLRIGPDEIFSTCLSKSQFWTCVMGTDNEGSNLLK